MRFENTVELLTVVKIVENYNLVLNQGLIKKCLFTHLFFTYVTVHMKSVYMYTLIICITRWSLSSLFSNTFEESKLQSERRISPFQFEEPESKKHLSKHAEGEKGENRRGKDIGCMYRLEFSCRAMLLL